MPKEKVNADCVLHTRLQQDVIQLLKTEAKRRGWSVSQMVRYIITKFFDK